MDKGSFGVIMEKWESTLESYGTPRNFADSSYIELLEGDGIPIRKIIAPGFANRKNLMEKQKEEAEKRKKGKPRWKNDGSGCFLCDNLGQAENIGNNLMLPYDTFKDFVLLPNKYPMSRGHFLLCQKRHDKDYRIMQDYVELMAFLCDNYGLSSVRNHKKAGMSIPDHEHVHLHAKALGDVNGGKISINGLEKCALEKTSYGKDVFSVSGTDFDTLAFKGKNNADIFYAALKKLEAGEKIFTFFYEPSKEDAPDGTFFLTVHAKQDERGRIAGNTPIYYKIVPLNDKTGYSEFMDLHREFVYLKGSFDWNKYLK